LLRVAATAEASLASCVPGILSSNRQLRRLLLAWAQSCLGTGAGYVALLLLTYRHLHTPWALTAVLLAEFVPLVALGSLFGTWADRYPKRRLIVTANLLQAVAYGGLAMAHTAPRIIGLATLAGIGNSLQRPALRSALPIVAGDAQQAAAAWYDACRWIGVALGPLLAAGLFAATGASLPLALNGLSFLVAAAVMATVAVDGPVVGHEDHDGGRRGLRGGLEIALRAPGIASVIGCSAGANFSGGLLNVCEPILATQVLHGSGSDFALLVASYGAGMIAATVLVARGGDATAASLIRRYLAAITLTAAGMTASAVVGSVLAASVAFLATGYANALQLVSETQLIQVRVPGPVQGRLFGAKDSVDGACFFVGLIAAGALAAGVGVRTTLGTGAALCIVCAVVAAVLLRRSADALAGEPPPEHAGI
jgi:MFS family permease